MKKKFSNHWSLITGNLPRTAMRGAAIMELLLSMALVAILIPFIVRWQQGRTVRAENIVIAKNIELVRNALERYIDENKKEFLVTVSKNISRVRISDLKDFGISSDFIKKNGEKFQLRILKSEDISNHSVLQGVIIMTTSDFTPMRTRELVIISGESAGFVEGASVYSGYGTNVTSTGTIGAGGNQGAITARTKTLRSGDDYIWRIPSDDALDATLSRDLNMGGHDMTDIKYADAKSIDFENILKAKNIVSGKIVYANRAELTGNIEISGETTVNGILSADMRSMQIDGDIILDDSAGFNSVTTKWLWADTLRLSGLTINNANREPAILKVNQVIDMTGGRVTVMSANVEFTGSLTPRLVISNMIQDAENSEYFWDISNGTAKLSDISFPNLQPIMLGAITNEDTDTESNRIMAEVAANSNATAADFMHALEEIKKRVRFKYQNLNLE